MENRESAGCCSATSIRLNAVGATPIPMTASRRQRTLPSISPQTRRNNGASRLPYPLTLLAGIVIGIIIQWLRVNEYPVLRLRWFEKFRGIRQ